MIKPDMIPDEVVKAVEKTMNRYLVGALTQSEGATVGHAVVAAALNAWPGMEARPTFTPSRIILPLAKD